MAEKDRVVIAGGGPVGMVTALALFRRGVPVTVLETLGEPFVDQRAASNHPPTMAMLHALGLAEEIIPEGLIAPVYRFHDRVTGEQIVEFDLGELEDELEFPYVLQYEQYKLVSKILALYGDEPEFDVRFSCAVAGFEQADDHVDVTVEHRDGGRETLRASYLIGCDGGRSTVRKQAGIAFEGFTYPELFIKIGTYYDFMEGDDRIAIRNYFSDPAEWCNLFKVNGEDGRPVWRGVFPMRVGETEAEAKRPETLEDRMQKFFPKPGAYEIAYANVYTVSQCVAETMNRGRVLLAGDSAHVNNPIGGMGLNGGIHDAMNLAEKLAPVWKGEAGPELLDRYTRQRRKAAVDFTQAQTIANKKLMEERDPEIRARNLDALRRVGDDRARRRAYMRRAALVESLEAAADVE
jgi:3-(3-hydroxy-phenyl)propionate hydroxylase